MAGILYGIHLAVAPPARPRLSSDDLAPEPPFQRSSISEPTAELRVPLLLTVSPLNTARSVPRCTEKGCVFPAARRDSDKCRQHERQDQEPAIFISRQPSMLLLDQAKFGPPDSDCEQREWRARDRRRRASLWQTFHEDTA
jgi:hypothetical protein